MKKILGLISTICILNVLMMGGLAGFLWQTGRLDKAKVQTISDMLKRPGTPEKLRENVDDLMKPVAATRPAEGTADGAATQAGTEPAAQPAKTEAGGLPATAEDRIDYLQKTMEQARLRLEDQAQNQQHEQELLAQEQGDLDLAQQKLSDDRKVFEAQVAASKAAKNDNGFATALSLFDELKPKQVKDLLMGMTVPDAAKYVTAMEPDRAAKILAEFKSDPEKTFMGSVMDMLRGVHPAAGTGAATAPVAAQAPSEAADLGGPRARAGP